MQRVIHRKKMGMPTAKLIIVAIASFPAANGVSATVLDALQPLAAIDSGAASLIGGIPSGQSVITRSTQMNDLSYWSAETAPIGIMATKTPLDIFGGATDMANAATATTETTDIAFQGGDLAITLAHDGLNVINLAIPDHARIGAITIDAPPTIRPNGAVIAVTASTLDLSGWTFNQGALDSSQVLIKFPDGGASSLRALGVDKGVGRFARIDYIPQMIQNAPIADEVLSGLDLDWIVTAAHPQNVASLPWNAAITPRLAAIVLAIGGASIAIFVAWRVFFRRPRGARP
jgi:hypothetical protein